VGGHELTVEAALDRDRLFNILYVRAGWPPSADLRRRRSLCLAEVYAISLTGTVRSFRGPELARFRVRALIEAGMIAPATVTLADLPGDAPAAAVATWKVIAEHATVRATTGDTGPMPLVAPWLASLNGTSEQTIRCGKRWLERHGFITHVADAPGHFGKKTKIWEVASSWSDGGRP
jgi:hypothetical protein